MAEIPADAQYSDDGNYWWDGSAWQPVHAELGGEQEGAVAAAEEGGRLTHQWGASVLNLVDVPEMQDEPAESSGESLA